jgi:tetratricopeptide (TPR) repeat protein
MRPIVFLALWFSVTSLAHAQAGAKDTAIAHAGAANRLMQDRRYAEASEEFRQALSLEPDNSTLRAQYATCLFIQENNQEAQKQFELLREKLGDRPGILYFLGQLQLRANHSAAAIQDLQPLVGNATFPKALYYLGLAYLSLKDDAKALAYLEKAAAQNPKDPEVHYRLARLFSKVGRDQQAESEYKVYNDLLEDKRLAEQEGHDCMDALKTKATERARAACGSLADSQDVRKLIFVGQLYLQAGAFANALAPLEKAAKLDRTSFDAAYYLGAALFMLRRYSDAVQPLENAVTLNPQYFDGLNLLAKTYHLLGNDSAALPLLERAHRLNPGDSAVTTVLEQMRAANSLKH